MTDCKADKDEGCKIVRSKVSWNSMKFFMICVGIPVISSALWVWAETRDLPDVKTQVENNKTDLITIKQQIKDFQEWKKEDKELKKEIIQVLTQVAKDKEAKNQ